MKIHKRKRDIKWGKKKKINKIKMGEEKWDRMTTAKGPKSTPGCGHAAAGFDSPPTVAGDEIKAI